MEEKFDWQMGQHQNVCSSHSKRDREMVGQGLACVDTLGSILSTTQTHTHTKMVHEDTQHQPLVPYMYARNSTPTMCSYPGTSFIHTQK